MSADRLAAVLDGARHITYCPDGLVLAWFGGHGLHVYALNGEEVDYRSVGNFADHEANYREIVAAARAYLCEEE
jgi:hypothetical protein